MLKAIMTPEKEDVKTTLYEKLKICLYQTMFEKKTIPRNKYTINPTEIYIAIL